MKCQFFRLVAIAIPIFFNSLCLRYAIAIENYASDGYDVGFETLVTWMRDEGGRVDDRIDIGMNNGIRGVVALDEIEIGAELLFCPWKLVIGSKDLSNQMTDEADMCNAVKRVAREIRNGADSLWFPYLDHIELPRLPATWGSLVIDELQGLPPKRDARNHLKWFQLVCEGGANTGEGVGTDPSSSSDHDEATMKSLVAFVSRASSVGMIPIYDLLNNTMAREMLK